MAAKESYNEFRNRIYSYLLEYKFKNITKQKGTFKSVESDADYEAVEEAFSFMTQYFCQRYENMATEKIDEVKDEGNYRQIGSKNIWETSKIKIILSSYNNMVDWQAVAKNIEKAGSDGWLENAKARDIQGYWVKLTITVK